MEGSKSELASFRLGVKMFEAGARPGLDLLSAETAVHVLPEVGFEGV
jgi:hypothetical protein